MNYSIVKTHKDQVRAGDTIIHNGVMMTVCKTDFGRDKLMGSTIFGDSYRLGYMPVSVVAFADAISGTTQ